MKIHLRYRQTSVFLKIIQAFLIFIIPLYLFCIQINIWGQNDVKVQIAKSNISKISFYMNGLEQEFSAVMKAQNKLLVNEDLQQLSTVPGIMSDFQKQQSILAVQTRLTELKEMSGHISEISVYLPLINKRITTRSIKDIPDREISSVVQSAGKNNYPFVQAKENYFINVTPPYSTVSLYGATMPSFVVSVEISRQQISHTLEQFLDHSGGGVVLLGDKNGLNIAHNAGEDIAAVVRGLFPEIGTPVSDSGLKYFKMSGIKYIVAYKGSGILHTVLAVFTPEDNLLGVLNGYKLWIWGISSVTVLFVILFSYWVRNMIMQPLTGLVEGFKKVEKGDLNVALLYPKEDEFGYIFRRFNDMCKRLMQLIEEVYEEKIRASNSELKQLQYQINPHFLYNSILIIYSLIRKRDNECAMKLSQHLASYYQYITRGSSDDVTLKLEALHAKSYLEIQQIRFQDRIRVEFEDVPEEYSDIKVPKLILQPILENSFNHGLHNKADDGELKVRVFNEGGYLRIRVEDNGDEVDGDVLARLNNLLSSTENNFESTGLFNVHRRLQIKFGPESGIFTSLSEMGGLAVEIRIPLKEESLHV